MHAYLHGTAILGSDLIGADGLQNQYVLLRVKNIDKNALQRKIKELPGAPPSPSEQALMASLAGTAVSVVDRIPKAVLDLAVPFLIKMLKDDYGIDAQITVSEVPQNMKVRERSEFFPGAAVGAVVGALLTSLVWSGKNLFFGK